VLLEQLGIVALVVFGQPCFSPLSDKDLMKTLSPPSSTMLLWNVYFLCFAYAVLLLINMWLEEAPHIKDEARLYH
jgi:hypothetical protein